jgi:hypothetical protein
LDETHAKGIKKERIVKIIAFDIVPRLTYFESSLSDNYGFASYWSLDLVLIFNFG